MRNDQKILHSPFDIETHKQTFVNYLEVILLKDGTITYAVPSHQEKLIALACEELSVSREELDDLCPPEFYGDFMVWLCNISHALPVWNDFYRGQPNAKQIDALQVLKEANLYGGKVPEKANQL